MVVIGHNNQTSSCSHAAAAALCTRLLPVVLALALLALPVLCIIHCEVVMEPTHHTQPNASDPISFFLCDLPLPTAAYGLFTPAFFPGVLPQLAAFTITLAVIRALLLPVPPSWDTLHSVPPTPPPR